MHERAPRTTESRVRVRYKETDQMGIAHHANYIVWFEIGRTDLCREAGATYRSIEDEGYLLVVTDIGCRYRSPYRYDDEVIIQTGISEVTSRGIRFAYRLTDVEGLRHADGFSSHLWLERASRRPVTAPEHFAELFRKWLPVRR